MCVSLISITQKQISITQNSFLDTILLSLTPVMVEKVLFLSQIFEMEILIDLHVMRTPESENQILNVWSMCVSAISITQK